MVYFSIILEVLVMEIINNFSDTQNLITSVVIATLLFVMIVNKYKKRKLLQKARQSDYRFYL